MRRTILAMIPAAVAGSARPCAARHGFTSLGAGYLGETSVHSMWFTQVNTNKPSTRWSRRRPT